MKREVLSVTEPNLAPDRPDAYNSHTPLANADLLKDTNM